MSDLWSSSSASSVCR